MRTKQFNLRQGRWPGLLQRLAKATLAEGECVEATGLKLTKQ